jgi:hypothetical protein
MQVAVLVILLQLFSVCLAIELTVGIYNEIPDLNGDNFTSYKNLIEGDFNNENHTVNVIVNKALYNPYGDLKKYLSPDGFDMIEMDMFRVKDVVDNDLIIEIPTDLPDDDLLPSALSSVVINGKVYGYPTLACGHFLVTLTPPEEKCNLINARSDYAKLYSVIEECKQEVSEDSQYSYERVIGGPMNDNYGWYLPFLYLDGYIDIHGSDRLDNAVEELTRGIVDPELCSRLSWLVGTCNDLHGDGKNKCYYNFSGSYVQNTNNEYPDFANHKVYISFGFSENAAEIQSISNREATAAISGPLGPHNILLQFTDALVINKARWNAATEEKRNAIKEFVMYFMQNSLRTKIAMGEDLSPPRVRYLLQATKTFYYETTNAIYKQLFWSLERAVPAPSVSTAQLVAMQHTLTTSCVRVPEGRVPHCENCKEEL